MKIPVILTALFVLFAGQLAALEEHLAPPSRKSIVRLNRAPVNKALLHIHLPRPLEVKLDNGLTVLILERHRLPTVHITLWIESGALSDPKDMPGLAKFTAETLREGTARRTSAQISSEIDALGAGLGASAGFGEDMSAITASGLASDLDSLFDLMADIALHPTFPDGELAKYKTRELSSLEEQRADPSFLASEKLLQELYPGSSAAVIAPTKDSLEKAAPKSLKEFHDHYYAPNNAMLGIAGDVTPKEAIALAKKYFGSWASQPAPVSPKITPVPRPFKIDLVDRPGSVQTEIATGHIAIAYNDQDHIPLVIANHVLGEGAESRLYTNLREDKGFAYDVSSSIEMERYPGPWRTALQVRNAATGDALRELLSELRRFKDEKVSVRELEDSKRTVTARFALSLESPSSLLDRWMLTKYYGLPQDYWDRYPEQAARVDTATVQRLAGQYLDLDHLQIVCVGDAKEILDTLKKFGPVEVYNTDGQRIP